MSDTNEERKEGMKQSSLLRRKWNRFIARAKAIFQKWNVKIDWLKYWSDTRQRHHDYFVFMHRQGKLNPNDQAEYESAMAREKAGQVKPLPEDATSPFG